MKDMNNVLWLGHPLSSSVMHDLHNETLLSVYVWTMCGLLIAAMASVMKMLIF